MLYQGKVDSYKTILECIRHSNKSFLIQVLDLLRTKEPLENITTFIQSSGAINITTYNNNNNNNNSTKSVPPSPSRGLDLVPFNLTGPANPLNLPANYHSLIFLGDMPLVLPGVETWTSVTNDRLLISHLISLYILHESQAHTPFFDQGAFLAAVTTGDQANCSPLLVNAILAQSCQYWIRLSAQQNTARGKFLGFLFLREALRLWNEQNNTAPPSVTTIQAGLIISRLMGCSNLESSATMIMDSTMAMMEKCVVSPIEEDPKFPLFQTFAASNTLI
ncbi:hypothetical protein AA313_de0207553 [Arthrobotrys entomopaga]|nr:hypothetical protein AA313_de0207553 [Arthrobotrys entomopaga]